MPGGSKKAVDAVLVAHLDSGVSPAGAAKLAGISEATAYRRLANPAFRQCVEKARSDFWDWTLGVMSKGAAESAIAFGAYCDRKVDVPYPWVGTRGSVSYAERRRKNNRHGMTLLLGVLGSTDQRRDKVSLFNSRLVT
ncbi:MAG TPA: hypothetical protein VH592_05045 [Gemmataceae bacterium]|jgi:hypothetical protein